MLDIKFTFIILLSFMLISCEKEREIITEDKETIPDTVQLIDCSFIGQVLDATSFAALENTSVTFNYDKYTLGKLNTDNTGKFRILNQPIHDNQSLITFKKAGYSPNYFTQSFTNLSEYRVNPLLKKLIVNQPLTGELTNFKIDDDLSFSVPQGIVNASDPKIEVQHLDFKKDDQRTLLANLSKDTELNFNHAFWVNISANDNDLPWATNTQITMQLSSNITQSSSAQLWYFDTLKARWEVTGTITSDKKAILNESGFYALISNCEDDHSAPVAISKLNVVLKLIPPMPSMLPAEFFDSGSYDDCSENLIYTVKKLNADCGINTDQFGPQLIVCMADLGKTISAMLKVEDESGNFNTVIINNIRVEDGSCPADNTAPTVITAQSVARSVASSPVIKASVFNNGSYDNCSFGDDLTYEVRKVVDVCSNGSGAYGPTISICAAEIGTTLSIVLRLTDKAGNYNESFSSLIVKP